MNCIKYLPLFKNRILIKSNKKIILNEMFLRDGLQSLKSIYDLETKKIFFNKIYSTNIKNIEFGSTTNPLLLPQMQSSYELWDYVKKYKYTNNLTMLISDSMNLEKCLNNGVL